MCEKSISNDYIFAVRENQIIKTLISKSVKQSVLHEVKKERNIKLFKCKTR